MLSTCYPHVIAWATCGVCIITWLLTCTLHVGWHICYSPVAYKIPQWNLILFTNMLEKLPETHTCCMKHAEEVGCVHLSCTFKCIDLVFYVILKTSNTNLKNSGDHRGLLDIWSCKFLTSNSFVYTTSPVFMYVRMLRSRFTRPPKHACIVNPLCRSLK